MVVLAWVMVGVGAAVQAMTGFGFSLVSAPFLIASYHAPLGIEINLVLSVALNVILLARGHHLVTRRAAGALFVPAALATVAIGLVLRASAGAAWTIAAGALCLAGTLVVWSGISFPRLRGPLATVVVGGLSGAMNVTTGVGGPPVVLFAVNARWEPATSRATMQAYFLGVNAVGLAILGPPAELPLPLLAAVVVGAPLGLALAGRLSVARVRTASLALAALGSLLAIARAL
ncbi:MAG TPA: sulfite exporter TauE/SafE family protein [Acidimicrobiales bacterium]|nr:sulfite exporter TauE/SafE family protein [Acidimicrobiales bacterium]